MSKYAFGSNTTNANHFIKTFDLNVAFPSATVGDTIRDASGNFYSVTFVWNSAGNGWDLGIFKITESGLVEWVVDTGYSTGIAYAPVTWPSVIKEFGQNLYILVSLPATTTTQRGVLIKITKTGTVVWHKYLTDSSANYGIICMVLDSSENIYFVSQSNAASSGNITKISSAGSTVWTNSINTATVISPVIELDELNQNVIMIAGTLLYTIPMSTGTMPTSPTNVTTYSSSDTSSKYQINSTQSASFFDKKNRMLYMLVYSAQSTPYTLLTPTLLKINYDTGAVVWHKIITGYELSSFQTASITVDENENIYLTHMSLLPGASIYYPSFIKFDKNGNFKYSRYVTDSRGSNPGNYHFSPGKIFVDSKNTNNLYWILSFHGMNLEALIMYLPNDGSKTGTRQTNPTQNFYQISYLPLNPIIYDNAISKSTTSASFSTGNAISISAGAMTNAVYTSTKEVNVLYDNARINI